MSMKTSIYYGYGFYANASDKDISNFILNHKDTILSFDEPTASEINEELIAWIEERTTKELPLDEVKEKFFDLECSSTGVSGLYGIIADVMTKETGIMFEYFSDYCEKDAIMFSESYPWNYNDKERSLTRDKLDEIIKPYIKELSIRSADYVSIELFG